MWCGSRSCHGAILSVLLLSLAVRAYAAETAYRPGYDTVVEAVDSTMSALEGEYYGGPPEGTTFAPNPDGTWTMTIPIPGASKMSEEEIAAALAKMRENEFPEEQIRRAEARFRTGTESIIIPEGPDVEGDDSGGGIGDTPAMRQFTPGDAAANSRWAMKLGADMAVAAAYGFASPEMVKTAGEAVKAFPHPLLLNNYGGMIMASDPGHALFFFQAADAQQPDTPLFLSNIASAFLELEDFAGAERYASMALSADPLFGPAHEVMAIVHLKNNNMELAVESTIKSARNCFTANTEYLFESMMEGIAEFLKQEFEGLKCAENTRYPVSEENMKLLYEVAKSGVSPDQVTDGIDTPEGQVTIPPFPPVGDGEALADMVEYFEHEERKYDERAAKRSQDDQKNGQLLFERSMRRTEPGQRAFDIDTSLRQKQAFYVVQQYYDFEIARISKRCTLNCSERKTEYDRDMDDLDVKERKYTKEKQERDSKAYEDSQRIRHELFEEHMKKVNAAESKLSVLKSKNQEWSQFYDQKKRWEAELDAKVGAHDERAEEGRCNRELEGVDADIDFNRKRYNRTKMYLGDVVDEEQKFYPKLKQFLEEYWLREGGIMKYVSDPLVLARLNYLREYTVDARLFLVTLDLKGLSSTAKFRLVPLKREYDELIERRQRIEEDCKLNARKPPPKPGRNVSDLIAQMMGGSGAAPEGERVPLSTFEEPNNYKLPEFGIDGSAFGFSASANADFDNMKFTTGLGSPVGGTSTETDRTTGKETMVETISGGPMHLFGVQADFQPLPPRDGMDRLKQLFTNKTALGFVISKLTGPVSLSHESGTYQTVDPKGRITDRGKVTIKTKGIGNDVISYSESTTITTSASGVSSKSTAKKFKFIFVTVTR